MASEERTRELLEGAGFTSVRMEEVPVRFPCCNVDEYETWVMELAGPFAMVVRGLPGGEREELKGQLKGGLRPLRRRRTLRASRRHSLCRGELITARSIDTSSSSCSSKPTLGSGAPS
jgi:hypothetical protein